MPPRVGADRFNIANAVGVLPLGCPRVTTNRSASSLGRFGLLYAVLTFLQNALSSPLLTAPRSFQYSLMGSQKMLLIPSS